MADLLTRTEEQIARSHRINPRGLICWSGGKDSMVLLHILKGLGIELPVIFFRELWQNYKYEFHEKIIREWKLLVYTWHPLASSMQQEGDEYEVQNWYQINESLLTCPTGITPPDGELDWACALDILDRPKQGKLSIDPFDALWIGHKGCDSDPILGGDCGTRIGARVLPGEAAMLFPLRDWSHKDVWDYIDEFGVPVDEERYIRTADGWRERPEKRWNADYVHACTRCLDRRESADRFVECPKLGTTIENVASKVPWAGQEKLSYMEG